MKKGDAHIGALRHRLIFQKKTETQDAGMGDVTETWADDFTVSGELMSSTSREYFEAQRRNSEMTAMFRIRYRTGIDPAAHRIWFTFDPNGSPPDYQIFDIYKPRGDNKKRWMLIEAREIDD